MRRKGLFEKSTTIVVLFLAIFFSISAFANENDGHEAGSDHESHAVTTDSAHSDSGHHEASAEDEEFEPSKLILEHIGDSHDWHLWGHTSVHLPVILWTDKGLETFSSGKFNHGHDQYQGKHYRYAIEHEHIKVVNEQGLVDEEASKNLIDLSITKNVASMFMSMILLFFIFFGVARAYKKTEGKAPKGFQSLIEPIILFVRDDIAKPNLGV